MCSVVQDARQNTFPDIQGQASPSAVCLQVFELMDEPDVALCQHGHVMSIGKGALCEPGVSDHLAHGMVSTAPTFEPAKHWLNANEKYEG